MTAKAEKTAGIGRAGPLFELAITGVAERWHAADDREGWRAFTSVLNQYRVGHLGLVFSGHVPKLGHALRAAGFDVVRIEPGHLGAYGFLTAGEAAAGGPDAQRVAALTALVVAEKAAPDARFATLSGHLVYLERAEEDLKTARARLAAHRVPAEAEAEEDDRLGRIYAREAAWAEERAARAHAELIAEIGGHADIAALFDRLRLMPGLDEREAMALAVTMPELLRLKHMARD